MKLALSLFLLGGASAFTAPLSTRSVQTSLSAATGTKQDFLEATPYWDQSTVPVNTAKNKSPFIGKVVSTKRIVGPKATGETCHIIIEHEGKMPYWEGQSYGVIPPGENPKKGICSNFLCDTSPGEEVQMTGPSGKVMLMPEEDPSTDLIMVATGTGIAPYRGFIRRLFMESTPASTAYSGEAWLFLGVANSDALLYDDEWQEAIANPTPEGGKLRVG